MEKLKIHLDLYFEKLNRRWKQLPLKRQHQYMLYFFCGYLLMTIAVTIAVCFDIGNSDKGIVGGHIQNPIKPQKIVPGLSQDTINHSKNKTDERQ